MCVMSTYDLNEGSNSFICFVSCGTFVPSKCLEHNRAQLMFVG